MKNSLVLRDSAVIPIKHLDQLLVEQEYFCTFYCNICTDHVPFFTFSNITFMYLEVRLSGATIDCSFDIKIFRYKDSINCIIKEFYLDILAYWSPCDEMYKFRFDMIENKFLHAFVYHYPNTNFDVTLNSDIN